jgi:hypothetical protein
MRLVGGDPNPLRRWMAWLVALGMLAVVIGLTVYARQQDAARRVAEGRADAAETQLAVAQASLTAIAHTSAAATATALAESNLPEAALRRALDLVFEAYKDPTDGKLRALSDAFSPDALLFERTEAEHLLSGALHLAGTAPYEMTVLSSTPKGPDETEIATHEVWTYDEVDAQNRITRCLREESDQTYTLRRVGANFLIQSVQPSGGTKRSQC